MANNEEPQASQAPAAPEPTPIRPPVMATLDAVRAAAKERNQLAPSTYTDPETGLSFTFKRLTGLDLDKINSWSDGAEAKYVQLLAETSSVEPKLEPLFWAELKSLGPMVCAGIVLHVRQIAGMSEEAIEQAKKTLSQGTASSSAGTS